MTMDSAMSSSTLENDITGPAPARIETARLTLRPWEAGDAADLHRFAAEWDLARMTSRIPHPYTRQMAEAFIAKPRTASGIFYAIARGGALVGAISLMRRDAWELGYWIGAGHRGAGVATEAASAVCAMGFEHLGLGAIHACVFADNPGSAKVLARLGFRHAYDCAEDSLARGEKVPSAHLKLSASDWRAAEGGEQR